MESSNARDEGTRRARVPCRICSRPVELLRLREHLRQEHQTDTTTTESLLLTARVEARRSVRSRSV